MPLANSERVDPLQLGQTHMLSEPDGDAAPVPVAGPDFGATLDAISDSINQEIAATKNDIAANYARRNLGDIELRPAPPVGAEVAPIAARRHQRASRLRLILLAAVQQGQFGMPR